MDGTVYRGNEVIPEASVFINSFQGKDIDIYYVTNNSSMTAERFQAKLLRMGIHASTDQIMTSSIAAATYCKQHFEGAKVMMIGEEGLEQALRSEGFVITDENPDVVVVGIDRNITYEKLSNAALSIRNGAHFIATNGDKAFPTERGLVPGNGSFVKLLETATDREATIVGKPEPYMLEFIQQRGYPKEDMVMIGDNYDTDIQAGIRFGIDTIHVSGGVTDRATVLKKDIQPTYLFDSLTDWK